MEEEQDELHHFMVGWQACFQEMQKRAADRAAVVGAEPKPSVAPAPMQIYSAPPLMTSHGPNWTHVAIGGAAVIAFIALVVALSRK